MVVFFPVTFLFGVSKYLFTALALAVVIALFASYFVAVTVVPLFCARFLKAVHDRTARNGHAETIMGREIPRLVQREIRAVAEFLRTMGSQSARPPPRGCRWVRGLVCC